MKITGQNSRQYFFSTKNLVTSKQKIKIGNSEKSLYIENGIKKIIERIVVGGVARGR